MGLSRLFGLCAAVLLAASVNAAEIIDLGPSDYKNFGTSGAHTSSGIRSSFGQTVRMPPTSLNTLTVTRNPVVPYASAAARMRPFTAVHPASVAASAAITGLFLAMEWYFDEDIGEWSVREVESIPPIEGTGWRINGGVTACTYQQTGISHPTPGAACTYAASCFSPPRSGSISGPIEPTISGGYRATCRAGDVSISLSTPGLDCPAGSEFNPVEGVCQQYVSVPVIEGEFSRLAGELPNLPADQVAEATGDAQRRYGMAPGYQDTQITGPSSISGSETTSTSTDPVTGDTVVTTTQTTTNITYGDTTITTTNTTTTNTYTNGQHTGSETVTETPGELPVTDGGGAPPAGEWPGFCEWASIVCDWIGWTQEEPPAEPDLPQVIDDDFYEEKSIRFGAKSCPPDYEISVPFINSVVAVPMQPLCDFAGIIYYMVMAAAYIIAAYITIGVARNG